MSSRYGKSSPTMALLLDGNGHLSWERTGALIVLAIFVVYSLGSRALYLLNAGRKLFMYHFIQPKMATPDGKRMPGPGPLVDTRFLRFQYRTNVTREFAEKYGPAYVVYNDTIPELVLSHPEAIKRYFANDGRVHRKAWGIGFGYYFFRLLGNAVGTMHNENWFRVRKVVDPHFHTLVVKDLLPKMSDDFEQWFAKLGSHPRALPASRSQSGSNEKEKSKDGSFEIDVLAVSERTPFKVVCRALFDPVMTEEDVDHMFKLNDIHEKLVETAFLHSLPQWSFYRFLPTAANRRMDAWDAEWERTCKDLIFRARKANTPSPVSHMYEAVEDGRMKMFELLQTCDEILYTNIDVTSTALAWSLIHMSTTSNAHYQSKVRAEMRRALHSDEDEWGAGRPEEERITEYIYRTDTLIHYCVLEGMRMVPLLFYSLPEVTAEEKEILGYRIPANTSVLIDAATLNRSSPCWSPDGDVYRPERFASLSPTEYRYSFWRFGLGPRKCVGQFFADKIVKMFLFHALRSFEYELSTEVVKKENLFVQTPEGRFRVREVERI